MSQMIAIPRIIGFSEKSWAFASPSGGGATFYIGGHYNFGTTNDFNPAATHGTADKSEAAHFFVVAAAGATDTVLTVTGTSINDAGTRTTSDTETLSLIDGSADVYYETSKKWLGQVSIEKTAGTDRLVGYGYCKYYDRNNTDFRIIGLEATWLAGASDSGVNILLRHHKTAGWTYNIGAAPTPPTALNDLVADHSTDDKTVSGENGAWKRANLSTTINGGDGEGTIVEISTSAASTFRIGNFNLVLEAIG